MWRLVCLVGVVAGVVACGGSATSSSSAPAPTDDAAATTDAASAPTAAEPEAGAGESTTTVASTTTTTVAAATTTATTTTTLPPPISYDTSVLCSAFDARTIGNQAGAFLYVNYAGGNVGEYEAARASGGFVRVGECHFDLTSPDFTEGSTRLIVTVLDGINPTVEATREQLAAEGVPPVDLGLADSVWWESESFLGGAVSTYRISCEHVQWFGAERIPVSMPTGVREACRSIASALAAVLSTSDGVPTTGDGRVVLRDAAPAPAPAPEPAPVTETVPTTEFPTVCTPELEGAIRPDPNDPAGVPYVCADGEWVFTF